MQGPNVIQQISPSRSKERSLTVQSQTKVLPDINLSRARTGGLLIAVTQHMDANLDHSKGIF